jgi:hypothetical protein
MSSTSQTTRQRLIAGIVRDLAVSGGLDINWRDAAEELLDAANRPYGRQYDALGYEEDNHSKRARFWADLAAAVADRQRM